MERRAARTMKSLRRSRALLLMFLLPAVYFLLFRYLPMLGLVMSFQDFNPARGFFRSEWVGLKHFIAFFNSSNFVRLFRNTFLLNIYEIVFSFPAPICLAIALSEAKVQAWKRSVQTVSYLPHFISVVIIVGIAKLLLSSTGPVNSLLYSLFGMEPVLFLMKPSLFRPVYVAIEVWRSTGWTAILYLAAITGINPELYDAARIDGANRWQQVLRITLPTIMPVIIVMLILRIGRMMNVSFESVLLLYNPATYSTADVFDTFIYRRGIIGFDLSFSTAVGFFKSLLSLVLVLGVNRIARQKSEVSLL